jgi:hypothetical protein
MSESFPEVRSLARALLAGQCPGPGAEAAVEAAERVMHRLADRLSPLVGVGGFHLLLQRALKRTRVEHAWLDAVRTDPEVPWRLPGMAEAAREAPEGPNDAVQALLAELIGLLARFLGADMTIRLVRQSFPEMRRGGETGAGSEETIDG